MYVGDPQIGASTNQLGNQNKQYYAMNDSYNWYHTLNNAVKKFPGLSFIMSAGDQINQTGVSNDADKLEQQIEYAGFLNPSVLRSLPVATTIGNHDSISYLSITSRQAMLIQHQRQLQAQIITSHMAIHYL